MCDDVAEVEPAPVKVIVLLLEELSVSLDDRDGVGEELVDPVADIEELEDEDKEHVIDAVKESVEDKDGDGPLAEGLPFVEGVTVIEIDTDEECECDSEALLVTVGPGVRVRVEDAEAMLLIEWVTLTVDDVLPLEQ